MPFGGPLARRELEAAQDLDQRLGLLAADLAGVAEQLLELIEQQADVAVLAQAEALPDAGERVAAAVQQAPDGARRLEGRLGVPSSFSCRRAIAVARFHKGELPGRISAVRQGTP